MNKETHFGKRADKTLESLNGIQRAEPKPYFYTRLIGRLQREEKTLWETIGAFLAKPVMVVVCLGFILVFNAFIVYRQDSNKESSLPGQQAEQLATDNEYILASTSSFEYENLDQQ